MADVDYVGQRRGKPESRGMDHAGNAAAAADIKVAQAEVRRSVRQQKLLNTKIRQVFATLRR